MRDRVRRIESDSVNQLSFLSLVRDSCVFIVKYMESNTYIFLSSYFFGRRVRMAFLIHTDIWQRMVIALLHTERTILVFQRRTLLNLFPHINLSRVLSLPHARMCPDYD